MTTWLVPDGLPTEEQRAKPCDIIGYAFVQLHILNWQGKAAQAADLAEAFHNLPQEM